LQSGLPAGAGRARGLRHHVVYYLVYSTNSNVLTANIEATFGFTHPPTCGSSYDNVAVGLGRDGGCPSLGIGAGLVWARREEGNNVNEIQCVKSLLRETATAQVQRRTGERWWAEMPPQCSRAASPRALQLAWCACRCASLSWSGAWGARRSKTIRENRGASGACRHCVCRSDVNKRGFPFNCPPCNLVLPTRLVRETVRSTAARAAFRGSLVERGSPGKLKSPVPGYWKLLGRQEELQAPAKGARPCPGGGYPERSTGGWYPPRLGFGGGG